MDNKQNQGKSGMGNQDQKRSIDRQSEQKQGQQINQDRTQERNPLGEEKPGPDRE